MNVTIFTELTTTEKLQEITKHSENYIGLYVDMAVDKERKHVKEQAESIKLIRTNLNTSRIKKVKDYTAKVNKEFNGIDVILADANAPFTLLIDGYAAERKVILDAEKASKLAIESAAQKELDHEWAIILDKSYLADKMEAKKAQEERDEAIRVDATNRATQSAKNAQEVTDRAIALDAANRLADSNNVRLVQRAIFSGFINAGLDKDAATKATQAIIDNTIPHITINY
tara:strand:- start:31336 stop:32022 length:687 start_codon:yes stop_codon:yes gene_type:complete